MTKKRGRPPLPDRDVRGLSMRTTFAVRRLLEEAATKSGRSLAAEISSRLEQSFRDSEVLFRLDRIEKALSRRPEIGEDVSLELVSLMGELH